MNRDERQRLNEMTDAMQGRMTKAIKEIVEDFMELRDMSLKSAEDERSGIEEAVCIDSIHYPSVRYWEGVAQGYKLAARMIAHRLLGEPFNG